MQTESSIDWSPQSRSGLRGLPARIFADPYLCFVALAPFYILLVSSNWIFSPLSSIDPWVYHGYFRNLTEYKTDLFAGTYYGSRLSWILPGYVAYALLPPLAANYVLHMGLWYAGVFALYYALKIAANRQAALVASVFLGSFIFFLRPVGSDYVDGPANVYFLVCFAFLTAAARREHNRPALVLAGAFFAAVVYTNLFTIIFAPVVLLYFALLAHRSQGPNRIRAAVSALAWFLLGAVALTIILGCANFLIEGSFQFYMPSVYYVMGHIGQPNPWKLPLSQWINQAEWLVVPLVVAVSALISLASPRFRASMAGPAATSAFLLACFLMILCEWRGIPVLQYPYYASYLIPAMFLAIGVLLERPLQHWGRTATLFVAFAVLLICTTPLWGHNVYLSQVRASAWPVAPLLFGTAFAIGGVLPGKAIGWGMIAALAASTVTSASPGHAFEERHSASDPFARVAQAADTVDAVRGDEFVWFWYDKTDPNFAEFHALHSIYLWGYTMIGDEFPRIKPDAVIADGALLVVPASKEEVLSQANEALYPKIFRAELVERRPIAGGGKSYSLWFARLQFDTARLEPLKLIPCESADCGTLVARAESSPAQLPLDGWMQNSDPQARIERASDQVVVTTALSRQGYAVKYGPLVVKTGGRYVFKLQYVLKKGGILFGAKRRDESAWLDRASIPVSQPGERTAVLSLEAQAGESFWLMISNDHPLGDHASEFVILELEAYRFPAQEVAKEDPSRKR